MDVSDDQAVLTDVPGPRGRRGIVSALGAAGVALLAALGRTDPASASGVFRITRVESDPSDPLPTTENGGANAFASCADARKPLSCGFILNGQASQLLNAMVTFAAPTKDGKNAARPSSARPPGRRQGRPFRQSPFVASEEASAHGVVCHEDR